MISVFDIAAIRGCMLNGATVEQIYAAFEGTYLMEEIRRIIESMNVKNAKSSQSYDTARIPAYCAF